MRFICIGFLLLALSSTTFAQDKARYDIDVIAERVKDFLVAPDAKDGKKVAE